MRVLLIGHVDGFGGAQTAFRKTIDFIQNEGHTLKVITITDGQPNTILNSDVVLGRILHHAPGIGLRFKKIFGLILSGIAAKKFKPQIFITIGLSNSANLISKYLDNSCYKIAQDFIADRTLDDELFKASKQAFDGIAVQSPSMLDMYKNSNTSDGLNWLPCFSELPEQGIKHNGSSTTDTVIKLCYFGRLAGNKGLSLLLNALANPLVPAKVVLDLWGKGLEEGNLRQQSSALNLNERVHFKGAYPAHREGAELMASYDALVLTSTQTEGLPLILIEAMAYGIPFLATNVGAIKDCFVDNEDAVLVNPSEHDVVQGLIELVNKIDTKNFDADRLQKLYKRTYSYEVMAARWSSCLQDPKSFFYGKQ